MRLLVCAAIAALVLMPATPASAQYLPPWATDVSRPEDITIKLVTFSPGDAIPSWFGHSAVVVEDVRLRQSRLYNYGMFSFDQAMLMRFVMGRLWFWVGDSNVRRTYDLYIREDRDVRVLELNLPPERRMMVAKYLANNVLPENREYLYHHYDDNCATRIRDVIDLATDGQFKAASDVPARMTLRDHTRRHSGHNALVDTVLVYWMNSQIDRPITVWDEMFLPEELEARVAEFHYVDESGERVPLVREATTVYAAKDRASAPEQPPTHWPYALVLGLLVGGVGYALARWRRTRELGGIPGRAPRVLFGLHNALLGLLIGVPALGLTFMWAFTEHSVTYWNQNNLLANALSFLILPLGLMYAFGSKRAARVLPILWLALAATSLLAAMLYFVGLVVPAVHQDISITLSLFLPLNLAMAAAWRLLPSAER